MTDAERQRRWRLLLGGGSADGIGFDLSPTDEAVDGCLSALYDAAPRQGNRRGGLGASAPSVTRWLGDIRTYFPTSVVQVMQRDALERLDLHRMLLEPELLEAVEPDVHLVSTLVSLRGVMKGRTRDAAREAVSRVVEQLRRRLEQPTRQAVMGSIDRARRTNRPRHHEIDWNRTIRANLKHYIPSHRTIIPDRRIGYARRQSSLRDIVLCVDQSGSMASSVVYSSIFAAVLASLPAVNTRLVVFDTAIVDLTDQLQDPVEVLFSTQLGGGTDINRALAYCENLVQRPNDTVLVLISDLFEGGNAEDLIRRAGRLARAGVQMVALLALSDDGAPSFDHGHAAALAVHGIPAFACTPDLFPELMAAAIQREDLGVWAASRDIVKS